eukprot:TRINITY_DN1601_c0_g1_i1.p1 TRINITY_DN1601_c0_g1~~TRINITY_DN1601_c0_g1_i1.p1  ORF type:complete len:131 (-),score=23.81 TRINITY_DN1601_c0_g1_i1:40-432(-)
MAQVGRTLWNRIRLDRELEQSLCRIRICETLTSPSVPDATTAQSRCGALYDQMKTQQSQYPNKACSGFAFGPGGTTPAPPEKFTLESTATTSTSTTGTSTTDTTTGRGNAGFSLSFSHLLLCFSFVLLLF